jgi:hypothetical protein
LHGTNSELELDDLKNNSQCRKGNQKVLAITVGAFWAVDSMIGKLGQKGSKKNMDNVALIYVFHLKTRPNNDDQLDTEGRAIADTEPVALIA